MLWSQLCRLAVLGQSPPDELVIHLDGNGLVRHPGNALILDVISDLKWLKARCPAMRIVWFTIIPHLAWRDTRFFLNVNTARRGVNREVCRAVGSDLGSVTDH